MGNGDRDRGCPSACSPGDGDEVVVLLFQMLGMMRRLFVEATADLGITPQQAHALRCLDPARPLPMRELASELMCDASTVTGLVDRLEDQGLVERRPDRLDRRVRALAVTAAGTAMRERLWSQVMARAPHLDALSVDERAQLSALLRRVVEGNAH